MALSGTRRNSEDNGGRHAECRDWHVRGVAPSPLEVPLRDRASWAPADPNSPGREWPPFVLAKSRQLARRYGFGL